MSWALVGHGSNAQQGQGLHKHNPQQHKKAVAIVLHQKSTLSLVQELKQIIKKRQFKSKSKTGWEAEKHSSCVTAAF